MVSKIKQLIKKYDNEMDYIRNLTYERIKSSTKAAKLYGKSYPSVLKAKYPIFLL